MPEEYKFLQRDLDAVHRKVEQYSEEWRTTVSGVHESTTQSSETWHDNPQFDDVQRRAKMLEAEQRKLKTILYHSVLVERPAADGYVHIGSSVRIRYVKTGGQDQFVIGGYMVLDADDDRISYATPMAKLLLGHTQGEVVSGKIGEREIQVEILEVKVADE